MSALISTILSYLPWLLVGLAIYLIITRAEQLLEGRSAIIIGVMAVVLLIGAVLIFRPQVLSFFMGPRRQIEEARANVITYALDPGDDLDTWLSVPAQAAAVAVESEYKLKTAKNEAGIAAALAAEACRLPKGHPDRAVWDTAEFDPCVASLPPVVVAASKNLTGDSLDQPFGTPPPGADGWAEQIYHLPKGAILFGGICALIVMVGLIFRLIR